MFPCVCLSVCLCVVCAHVYTVWGTCACECTCVCTLGEHALRDCSEKLAFTDAKPQIPALELGGKIKRKSSQPVRTPPTPRSAALREGDMGPVSVSRDESMGTKKEQGERLQEGRVDKGPGRRG